MRYRIRTVNAAHYDDGAPYGRHLLRVQPRADMGQVLHDASLEIAPTPSERHDGLDYFGNSATWLSVETQHESFVVRTSAHVTVPFAVETPADATPRCDVVRAAAMAHGSLDPLAPAHYLFTSRIVRLSDEITAFAAPSFADGAPILSAALHFMWRIHNEFAYDADATDVDTRPEVAFAARRGVCQDFAHVMIAGMRGLGLPAAYVSGFLRTLPPPGQPRLEGADATHAWVAVWCGADVGWVGLDPTNNMRAGEDHVIIAIGRDYADVAPQSGVVLTHGSQRLDVAVDVAPSDP